jgi:bacterioferritin-associated ferredoxin
LQSFDDAYEVCNCKNVTVMDIKKVISYENCNLGKIQELTSAGTECRFCLMKESDFGKIKKKVYCKDILNDYIRRVDG